MKTIITKKYELSKEDFQALEKTKEIFDTLCNEGFGDDFCVVENVYLVDTIEAIDAVIRDNGEDWV